MIAGVGIDSVEIDRFNEWAKGTKNKLDRVLSEQEIKFCLSNKIKSAERFAARFATREAFFKALSQVLPDNTFPFLTVCKKVTVDQGANGNPILIIDWKSLLSKYGSNKNDRFLTLVSITHTKTTATAIVIVEQI